MGEKNDQQLFEIVLQLADSQSELGTKLSSLEKELKSLKSGFESLEQHQRRDNPIAGDGT